MWSAPATTTQMTNRLWKLFFLFPCRNEHCAFNHINLRIGCNVFYSAVCSARFYHSSIFEKTDNCIINLMDNPLWTDGRSDTSLEISGHNSVGHPDDCFALFFLGLEHHSRSKFWYFKSVLFMWKLCWEQFWYFLISLNSLFNERLKWFKEFGTSEQITWH